MIKFPLEEKLIVSLQLLQRRKKAMFFKVTAKAKVSKKDSQTIKYGLQGKTITVVEKKTFFDYYKDKLLNKNQK